MAMSGSKGEKDAGVPDGHPSADGDHDMEPSVTGKRFLDVKGKLSVAQGKYVSEDRDTFQNIMKVFSEYEIKMRAGGLRSNMTDVVKMWSAKKSLDPLFPRDFPFYLILANRIHCLGDVYRQDTFGKFVAACSGRFQDLSNSELQETLVAGFLKREDFEIAECASESKSSVFKLLEDACLGFAKRSSFSERKKLKTPIYSSMLWISVALKCHCARGAVTRGANTMWQLHFLETHYQLLVMRTRADTVRETRACETSEGRIVMHHVNMNNMMRQEFAGLQTRNCQKCQNLKLTPEMIEELEKGTGLGVLLELPSELAFHPEWLGDSFISKDNIQLLSHLREFVKAMDIYISLESEFCTNFLKLMRGTYSWHLEHPTSQGLQRVCRDGTLLSAVREGLAYLDLVRDVIMKKWELKQELQEHFQKWLSILVGLVDITSKDAEECIAELLKSELQIVKMFSEYIKFEIIEATRNKLLSLPVDRLFHLYSTFDIWETSHMDHYFQNYEVLSNVDLTDVLWGKLFGLIQSRSKPGESLDFILKLLKEVAETYTKQGKASDFIISLLKLSTPWLFSELPQQQLSALRVGKATPSPNTRSRFAAFLTGYIGRHSLNHMLLKDINIVWECCSDERNDFQELVLSCIAKEIISDISVIKGTMEESLQCIISKSCSMVCDQCELRRPKSAAHMFCWAVIGACCQRIPIDRANLDWISDYSILLCELGQIYQTFSRRKSDLCLADTDLSELACGEIPDVAAYFKFVLEMRQILKIWNDKFTASKINNCEICTYGNHWNAINELSELLGANSFIVTSGDVASLRKHFLKVFEKLNIALIKYIPGKESKRIDVIAVLSRYGVSFPNNLQSAITHYVAFPSEDKYYSADFEALPVSITGQFKLEEGFVKLSRCIQLKQLESLVLSIERFTEPLCNHMDMLVYFTIHESKMFDSYLKVYLTSEDSKQEFLSSFKENSFEFEVYAPSAKSELDDTPTQELIFLQQALRKTKILLQRIGDGSATYDDVTVKNTLDLNIVVLDHEIQTISSYLEGQIQPVFASYTHVHALLGPDYIRYMLGLFELRKYIHIVVDVLNKFELRGCLDDPSLDQLISAAESLDSELKRSVLTLSDANQKMDVVKECLCLQSVTDFTFLTLFTVLADSVPFFKFLCSGNFTGMEGRERFIDKCQLITTQLQHVDYNEVVLNHLIAAYEYIFPFTNKDQTLQTLMSCVSTLDVSKGCKQLKTVNHNIDLIKIWFSAQPGDTIHSILHELDSIFKTGHYQFALTSTSLGSVCHLELVYQHTPTPVPVTSRNVRVEKGEGSEASQSHTHRRGLIAAPPPTHKSICVVWDNVEITDFVHKLGFLDATKTGKDSIKHFQKIYQVAQRLAELYLRLQKIGHEDYQQKRVTEHLTCSTTGEEAEKIEEQTRQKLSKCREMISAQHKQYEWLIFFSTAKVLKLYQQLVADPPNVDGLVDEIALLLVNKPAAKQALITAMEERLQGKEFFDNTEKAPMPIVGNFLRSLLCGQLEEYSVKSHCKNSHCKEYSQPQCCWGLSKDRCSVVLHHSPWQTTFSQKHLVMLVISLYDGAPEAFQVFQCKPSTTDEEIQFFFQRVVKYPQSYLVLGIDSLPVHLQEVFLQLFLDHEKEIEDASACLHLVESAPSVLREIPRLLKQEHKDLNQKISKEEVMMKLRKRVLHPQNLACIELLYGPAGAGKSHQIKLELKDKGLHSVTIAVNEAFTLKSAVSHLHSLPKEKGCAVVFNFTMIPPHESMDDSQHHLYNQQMETVRWFFFSLLILGYVEDPVTGLSFQFPFGLSWIIFVEVPSLDVEHSEDNLLRFKEQIPVLGLLGVPHYIHPVNPFTVDSDVKYVCRYLKAFEKKTTELTVDIEDHECTRLLKEYIPKTIQGVTTGLHVKENKTAHRLFLKYLKHRCAILDSVPKSRSGKCRFIWKESKKKSEENIYREEEENWLPVFEVMLQEVCEICQWSVEQEGEDGRKRWTPKLIKQLIYGERKGVPTFELLDVDQNEYMKELGIRTSESTLLHSYLSHALGIPLNCGRLVPVDQSQYLLTLDNTIKMLHVHERFQCGVPVIIEGETGVGKTTLIEMLSKLWNHALLAQWEDRRRSLINLLKQKLRGSDVELILSSDDSIMEQQLLQFLEAMVVTDQNEVKEFLKEDPLFFLFQGNAVEHREDALEMLGCKKNVARLLRDFLKGKFHIMFHKLSIHSGLKPVDILQFFEPILSLARKLSVLRVQLPRVTVFLDEVNTSSCLGLLKEIIVDQTINGEPIPPNVFIIAACNPHRANSLAILDDQTSIATTSKETWVRGSYYVQKLPPTFHFLMWDYVALDDEQEREYIRAKLWQINKADVAKISREKIDKLTHLIAISHNLMREYAMKHLADDCELSEEEASIRSQSFVSQRDIQRVFTFYEWLMRVYSKLKPHGVHDDYSHRAVLVALGIVYYLRLNDTYRKKYRKFLDSIRKTKTQELIFSKAFEMELDWYINLADIPSGVAKTQALKENLFAIIVCTMTRTPLIIIGPPGSSKTLSFRLAIANLKGEGSKVIKFRTEVFHSLDPHIYQCSRRTTPTEIEKVFKRAINRQKEVGLSIYCVVFMDEVGLPEEKYESLKVLHQYLDASDVSFVGITNRPLDAAKSNRAVTLYRLEPSNEDLLTLAKGCFAPSSENLPPELLQKLTRFCAAYTRIVRMELYHNFFGLRDFIHFIRYLRRNKAHGLSSQVIMQALERNFGGTAEFENLCQIFLSEVDFTLDSVHRKNILDVLKESLKDCPSQYSFENEVRYKIIIDLSEDSSLVRLLFSFGVLKREPKTRMHCCSSFLGNTTADKVNAISAVLHSVSEGHTVLMYQTDEIHESFYNLFNQNFHCIDDPEGPCYFTNIAIGPYTKPCLVHREFQCVIVIKQSEMLLMPPPFLSRFEKYLISHQLLLESRLTSLPTLICAIFRTAHEKVDVFLKSVHKAQSVYGLQKETLDSLVLSMLPAWDHKYERMSQCELCSQGKDTRVTLLDTLITAFVKNAGFYFHPCSRVELEEDARSVFDLVLSDTKFAGFFEQLSEDIIARNTVEALNALYNSSSEALSSQVAVSTGAALVINILHQWVIRYLCKSLMQLMTPEALALHQEIIPLSYRRTYLLHQHHFSLRGLITSFHKHLKDRKIGIPNKLLCYTRSSGLIHKIPSIYPRHSPIKFDSDSDNILQRLVFHSPKSINVFKLLNLHSYRDVNNALKGFIHCDAQEIMLIPINMKEIPAKVVNELRIMIEEAENELSSNNKLFVLLLHFPPSMFIDACYPALFLQGWIHYYLDTVLVGTDEGNVDIQNWFQNCCADVHVPPGKSGGDTLSMFLPRILKDVTPILPMRLSFGSLDHSPFNRQMLRPDRMKLLQSLLLDGSPIGEALIMLFKDYWNQTTMAKYLQKAARFTRNGESTLNMTDCLQEILRTLFLDFLLYMVSKMNENLNLDVWFESESLVESASLVKSSSQVKSAGLRHLFIEMVKALPVPHISELKMAYSALREQGMQCVHMYAPKFPFFAGVSELIEKGLHESQEQVNQQLNVLDESSASVRNDEKVKQLLVDTVLLKLHNMQDDYLNCLKIAVEGISSSKALWDRYFIDFTHTKLHMEYVEDSISNPLLKAAFGGYVYEGLEVEHRIVLLHVHFHVHQLELAKLAILLRSLDRIKQMASTVSQPLKKTIEDEYIEAAKQSRLIAGEGKDLAVFIIETLFNTLEVACATDESRNLLQWYHTYSGVMLLPFVKKFIYSYISQQSRLIEVEAKINIMHATYAVVHSSGLEDFTKAQVVFTNLYTKHFSKESMKMTKCPNLPDIAMWTLALVSGFTDFENLKYSEQVAILMELHFSHFFSKERCDWAREDISWFLRLANEQSHWKVCYVQAPILSANTNPGPTDAMPKECIPMTVFQFFLSRLLLLHTKPNPTAHSLCENNPKALDLLRQVLAAGQKRNQGPYNPKEVMNQPLAHLYFLVVLEQHLNRAYDIQNLLQIADNLEQQSCNQENDTGKRILASIERQALLQVILKTVAQHLDLRKSDQLATLANHSQAVQKVVLEVQSHRLMLALYMLKQLQSFQMFTTIVTTKDLCNELECLGYFHDKFEKTQEDVKVQIPLVGSGGNDELDSLYKRVCKAMKRVHYRKKLDHLQKLAQECKREQKQLNFHMMIWLCAYYEFFNMKKSSPELATKISTVVDLEEQPLAMLQCLINSKLIRPENRDAELILQALDNNSLIEVHHTLITLVAVILGSPPRTSYLWYLLFQPEKLLGSYIPGFLLEKAVDPEGGDFYDTGVELTSTCVYSRDDYARYAMKGVLSLHSLYTLLWANLGVMSMAILFLPKAGDVIRRKFISPQSTEESYFVSHLMQLWRCIPQNLGISEEDCSFLLMTCFKKFREFSSEYMAGECFHGIYYSQEECETFEALWHKSIFQPAWVDMQHHHQQVCKNEVFLEIRHFDSCNPHFPSTSEFVQNVLSKADLSKFHLLAHIILQQPLLQAGRLLLPVLIEFYQWLHSDLAYLVTEEYAHEMTIGKVVAEASKHYYSSTGRKDLSALYKQLKDAFAEYLQLMGERDGDGDQSTCAVVQKSSMMFVITDETCLLQLLSTSTNHGSLYSMIESIIKCHNTTLDILEELTHMPRYSHMKKYTTEPYTSLIHPTEFKQHTSIMGKFTITTGHDEFEQLVRRRYQHRQHYTASTTVLTEFCGSASILEVPKVPKFDLHQMQEDFAVELVAGKPRIKDASNLRKNFFFKRIRIGIVDEDIDQDPRNLAQDLASLDDRLPTELKCPLDQKDLDSLELYFHSFTYHGLQEVAAGLCTAIELLIRKLRQDGENLRPCDCNLADLLATENTEKLAAEDTENPLQKLMEKVGIQSLSLSRMRQLSVIRLPYLFASLQIFVHWIKVGQYDYCSLPHRLKVHLLPKDEIALWKISDMYDGTIPDLIGELNTLTITLNHCETHFVQMTVKDTEEPIKQYLKEHHCTSDYEKLPKQIPDGVLIKHYVQFRIQLRRLMDQVHKQVSTPELVSAVWNEVAPPIVRSHLQAVSEEEEQLPEQHSNQLQEETVETSQPPMNTTEICPEIVNEQNSPAKQSEKEATVEKSPKLTGEELAACIEKQSKEYTHCDVAEFLQNIGLERYAETFTDMEITGDRLIDPDDLKDILEELGVTNPVHQLKILAGFKRKLMCDIGVPSSTDPRKTHGKDPLSEFLKRFKMPPSYVENFISGDIDWELLLYVTDYPLEPLLLDILNKALEQIGITKHLHKHLFKKNFGPYIRDNFCM